MRAMRLLLLLIILGLGSLLIPTTRNPAGEAAPLLSLPFILLQPVMAANPSAGSISPSGPAAPFTGSWAGTATGGTEDPSDPEAGCTEGITCDTFTLTVLPGVYTGKQISISASWTNPSNDYDLFIYKGGTCPATGTCTGQFITSSRNVTGTQENATINPNSLGTGDYKIRVVYVNVPSPAGDQYQASASLADIQGADLSVSKSGQATIVADTDAEYTVSVSNFSGTESTPTNTLTDTFPAELTFVSAVLPDGWTCTTPPVTGPNSITCTSTNAIPDESSVIFTFTFHVAPALSNGTQVTNSASISHEGLDPNSMNNETSFTSTVGEPPPAPLEAGEVLFSEFRLSGPGGSQDDYIELYCNRDTDCDISGSSLRAYDPIQQGDFSLTFPPQTIIPARHYLLVADTDGYTLDFYGIPDFDVALIQPPEPEPPFYFYDNEGLQLISSGEPTVIDSVGFAGGGNDIQYVEGSGLQRASSRPADQYAYVRKRTMATNGLPQDTNDNAQDFVLVSVTGALHPGITNPPVLGAPGPQGLSNPISITNAQLTFALTDPTKSKEEDPNRVRVGTGDSGTLSLRRSFTDNSSFGGFLYIAFRVIETSTLNSPNTLGSPQADLRLISSSETSAVVPSRGGPIPIFGTVLEYDDLCGCPEPKQPNGGGLNSTVYVDPGEGNEGFPSTFDAQFLFNVNKAGAYRFYVYAEAIPDIFFDRSLAELTSSPGLTGKSRARSKTTTPRKFASAKRHRSAATKQMQRTPVSRPMTGTSATPVTSPANSPLTRLLAPRVIIINRGIAEGEKKPRKKRRVRRKNSAALQKKAEEKFALAAEKPQN